MTETSLGAVILPTTVGQGMSGNHVLIGARNFFPAFRISAVLPAEHKPGTWFPPIRISHGGAKTTPAEVVDT